MKKIKLNYKKFLSVIAINLIIFSQFLFIGASWVPRVSANEGSQTAVVENTGSDSGSGSEGNSSESSNSGSSGSNSEVNTSGSGSSGSSESSSGSSNNESSSESGSTTQTATTDSGTNNNESIQIATDSNSGSGNTTQQEQTATSNSGSGNTDQQAVDVSTETTNNSGPSSQVEQTVVTDNSGSGNANQQDQVSVTEEPVAQEPIVANEEPTGGNQGAIQDAPGDTVNPDEGAVSTQEAVAPAGATISVTSSSISESGPSDQTPAVGQIDPTIGFPEAYQDAKGIAVVPCLDGTDPNCVLPTAGEEPNFDPSQPTILGNNFPSEFFYWIAESDKLTTPNGGKVLFRSALEGAFLNEDPLPGDQVVFGRLRLTGTGLEPNSEYTVTHPYGVDTYVTNDVGVVARKVGTEDIGCEIAPCDFSLALDSRIFGGFLAWDNNAPLGYLGDGVTPHTVMGGITGNNFFRIEGPGLGDNGLFTNLFTVAGKLLTEVVLPVILPPVDNTTPEGDILPIDGDTDEIVEIPAIDSGDSEETLENIEEAQQPVADEGENEPAVDSTGLDSNSNDNPVSDQPVVNEPVSDNTTNTNETGGNQINGDNTTAAANTSNNGDTSSANNNASQTGSAETQTNNNTSQASTTNNSNTSSSSNNNTNGSSDNSNNTLALNDAQQITGNNEDSATLVLGAQDSVSEEVTVKTSEQPKVKEVKAEEKQLKQKTTNPLELFLVLTVLTITGGLLSKSTLAHLFLNYQRARKIRGLN